jgi:hypothetical protein
MEAVFPVADEVRLRVFRPPRALALLNRAELFGDLVNLDQRISGGGAAR